MTVVAGSGPPWPAGHFVVCVPSARPSGVLEGSAKRIAGHH